MAHPQPHLGKQQHAASMNVVPTGPHVPPESNALDKQRVALILDINQILLEETVRLQAEGKGSDSQSPSTSGQQQDGGEAGRKSNREYVEPLRRMQANLAYLASLAERHGNLPTARSAGSAPQTPQPWPQIMTPPPGDERLVGMYAKLQSLFPMWKLHQQKLMAAQQHQQAQQQTVQQGMSVAQVSQGSQ